MTIYQQRRGLSRLLFLMRWQVWPVVAATGLGRFNPLLGYAVKES